MGNNFTIEQSDWYSIDEIICKIQEADINSIYGLFPSYIRKLVPYSHSLAYTILDPKDVAGKKRKCNFFSHDLTDECIELYKNKYMPIDFINWYIRSSSVPTFRESDVVADAIRINSTFYKEWLLPFNLHYGIVMPIKKNDIEYLCVTLYRSQDEGDFSIREKDILSVLSEHIAIQLNMLYPFGLSESEPQLPVVPQEFSQMFTRRENEIINLMTNGIYRTELAKKMYISENTLNKHLANIYVKLGIHTYEELLRLFTMVP